MWCFSLPLPTHSHDQSQLTSRFGFLRHCQLTYMIRASLHRDLDSWGNHQEVQNWAAIDAIMVPILSPIGDKTRWQISNSITHINSLINISFLNILTCMSSSYPWFWTWPGAHSYAPYYCPNMSSYGWRSPRTPSWVWWWIQQSCRRAWAPSRLIAGASLLWSTNSWLYFSDSCLEQKGDNVAYSYKKH